MTKRGEQVLPARRFRPAAQHGFSLVELMVAMVIGLLVVAGAFQLFVSTRQTYGQAMAISQRQSALRFASDVLLLDLRTSYDMLVDPTIELSDPDATPPADLSSCQMGVTNHDISPDSAPEAVADVTAGQGRVLHLLYRASRRNDPACPQAGYPHLYQARYFSKQSGDRFELSSCHVCRATPADGDFSVRPSADQLSASAVVRLQREIAAHFERESSGIMSLELLLPAVQSLPDEPVANRTFTFTAVERDELVSLLGLGE